MNNNVLSNLNVSLNVSLEIDSKTIDIIANLLLLDVKNKGCEGLILTEDAYGNSIFRVITRENYERIIEFLDKEQNNEHRD